jgi:two-component system chemotaxis response regulator CheY
MKVLIVDDDIAYIQLLRIILKSKKHEVVEASDGKAAWELLQQNTYPFLITDWMLPKLDGPELIRLVRAANFSHYTYIIMLTAKHAKGDMVDGLESGADDYLIKPFDLSELRARISIGERILNLETRLRDSMDQLYVYATRDSLTGLLNRRALYESVETELKRAKRELKPISMILMDVDHFKLVNDQYGHRIGDQALCMVAQTLEKKKRPYDLVGRWGGEEFLLILPGTGLEDAKRVAERIRVDIDNVEFILKESEKIHLQASFGVVCMDSTQDVSFDELVQRADEALYIAKNEGRNRVYAY